MRQDSLSFLFMRVIFPLVILFGGFLTGVLSSSGNDPVEIETENISAPNILNVIESEIRDKEENEKEEEEKGAIWGRLKECPFGSVVTGYKFVYTPNYVAGSPSGIAGVGLQCSKVNYWNNFVEDKVIFDGIVSARLPWTYSTNKQAVGFTFETWVQFGGLRRSGNWKFRFAGENLPISFPPGSTGRMREEAGCPESYAVCGFRVLRNRELDRIIRLKFTCCYYCVPEEIQVVVYDFTNNGITDVIHTITKRIGLSGGDTQSLGGKLEKTFNVDPSIEGETGQTTMLASGSTGGGGGRSRALDMKSQILDKRIRSYTPFKNNIPLGPPSMATLRVGQSTQSTIKSRPDKIQSGTTSRRDVTEPQGPPRNGERRRASRQGTTTPPPSGGGPNPGSTGGGSPSAPTSGGSSPSTSGSSPGGGSGSSNFNLKARFEAKFGASKSKTFNWQSVSWSQWNFATEETDTLVCKALHRCVLKQLVGNCGKYQFHTPQFDFTHIPIRLDYFDYALMGPGGPGEKNGGGSRGDEGLNSRTDRPPPMESEMEIKRPGENWIVIQNLTFARRSRIWEKSKSCPPGSVVTAQQIKTKPGLVFTGLGLQCSKLNSSSQFEYVTIMSAGSGMPKKWYNSSTEATGATHIQYRLNGTNVKQNFEMRFAGEEDYMEIPPGAQNVVRTEVTCPTNHAICGMQAMFDMDQRGEMTDIAFRCCHHCNPEEKIVILESFTNLGFTDTIQTVTRVVGNVMNSGQSHSGNNLTENTNIMDGISPAGLQAGFAAKFDNKIDAGFNWATTSTAFWTNHEEKTLTVLCKARMMCVYRQLIGVCNNIEIPTPYTIKESFPLDNMTVNSRLDPDIPGRLRIRRSGETWMVAQNLTFDPRSDLWEPPMMCPGGSFVTAQHLKRSSGFRFGGLSLRCSRLNGRDEFVPVMELTSGTGNDTRWYDANSPAIGFTFIEYELNGTMWKAKWEVRFENDTAYHRIPKGAVNVKRNQVQCPPGNAITGMMTMFDKNSTGQLTNIGFRCSFYCNPKEKMIILNAFTNDGDTDTTQSIKFMIGTRRTTDKTMASNPFEGGESGGIFPTTPAFNPMDLQEILSSKFGNSQNFQGFSWAETTRSLWTSMEEKSMKLPCPSRHLCTFKQLTASCSNFEILSPYTLQKTIPLNGSSDSSQPVEPTQPTEVSTTEKPEKVVSEKSESEVKVRVNGELWIMAENLTSSRGSGVWNNPQLCPPGSIVTSFILNQTPNNRFAGMSLRCSRVLENNTFETVREIMNGWKGQGVMENVTMVQREWVKGNSHAIGFSYNDFEIQGSIWRAQWKIHFWGEERKEQPIWKLPKGARNAGMTQIQCPDPERHAICGQQNMFDKDRKGVLTSVAFKCCYLCTPKEKVVIIDSFRNQGRTDTTVPTVQLTVGTRLTKSRLTELEEKDVVQNNLINPSEIQANFASWFENMADDSKSNRFDWLETSLSLFREEEVKMTSYLCPGRHYCSLRQVVGFCGDLEVRTPYIIKESLPLDFPSPHSSTKYGSSRKRKLVKEPKKVTKVKKRRKKKLEIKRTGEIWIVAQDLTATEPSGSWTSSQLCPPGAFVTSEQFRTLPGRGLSGLNLQCSNFGGNGSFVKVGRLTSGSGTSKSKWFEGKEPATGFTYTEFEVNGSYSRAHWEVSHKGKEEVRLGIPGGAVSVVQSEVTCPQHHVVCGFQTMFDKRGEGLLTNVGFKCCYHCVPELRMVTLDLMTNLGNLPTRQKVKWMIGTKVEGRGISLMNGSSPTISVTPAAIRAIFASRFGSFNPSFNSPDSNRFNWTNTPNSLFSTEDVKITNYICAPKHYCSITQLVGRCGTEIEVSTPYILKESFSLDPPTKEMEFRGNDTAVESTLNMTVISAS